MTVRKKDLAPMVMPNGKVIQPKSKTQERRMKWSGGSRVSKKSK